MKQKKIIIATIKSWNIKEATLFMQEHKRDFKIKIITERNDLDTEFVNKFKPDYIFFPHWSWIIPDSIWKNYKCIVFHMTDLPFGRGGSPLQNLLIRQIYKTKISALKVTKDIDAGDIYMKYPVNIKSGNADQILKKISKIIFDRMIQRIINNDIFPKKQVGQPTIFLRRKQKESYLLRQKFKTLTEYYDFIRMLDGEGYPKAFIKQDGYQINFYDIYFKNKNILKGEFEIIKNE